MPEMDGVELVVQIRRLRPNLPLLFVSGFCEKIPGSFQNWEGLDKPFRPAEMLEKIANMLHNANSNKNSVG
jgi:DNA-binding response OmpR family regulator